MELGVIFKGGRHNARGFIVVAVLWILATLSALVLIYLTYVTNTAAIVAGSTDRVQTEALVTAAVELTAYRLTGAGERDRPTHGTFNAKVGVARLSVMFRSEAARVDLNSAPKGLLVGLIGGLGATPSDAESYADRIIAWRTSTKSPADDPENSFYRALGLTYVPRHAPFPEIEELWLVQGIPSTFIERMLPFVTVFSNLASISILDAAPEVVAALPGMTPERLQAVLTEREKPGVDPKSIAGLSGTGETGLMASRAYRLSVGVEFGGGRQTGAEVIILLLDDGDEPYRVLSWRNGVDGGAGPQRAALR
ncbi:general secretion pathway protein GspK [Bradyrhizobium sp.]|uniref:general secretion pathway protein GspK n=1 Tax=Bradyrhizobium sp. TaxID=376 RepID=UPI003C7436B1